MANRSRMSHPSTPLEELAWPPLDEVSVDRLRSLGEERELAAGAVLFEVGDEGYDFYYLETGSARVIDRRTGETVVRVTAGNFLGELGLLTGQRPFLAGEVDDPARVVVVDAEEIRRLVAEEPELGNTLLTAFAARRRLIVDWEEGALVLVGREEDPLALRLRQFLGRNFIPFRWLVHGSPEGREVIEESGVEGAEAGDLVAVIGDAEVVVRPNPLELARHLGIALPADHETLFDLVVVGAGPAGLAAAVYGASEGLSTLILEDTTIGGQAGTSSRIENYLGFPAGLSGGDLAFRGEVQAIKFGARFAIPRRASALREMDQGFEVALEDGCRVRGRAVLLACGALYRRLEIEDLERFEGAGVYYAATELEARFCQGSDAVIVGGGNSAGQAAMFLARYARCTHVLVRGDDLSATMSSYLSNRLRQDPRIRLWTGTTVRRLRGDGGLEQVEVERRDGSREVLECRALFSMIGAVPNTAWLEDFVALDGGGFVVTGAAARPGGAVFEASRSGVFAVGDVRSGSVKRVASAVGEGSVAVSLVHQYLARV